MNNLDRNASEGMVVVTTDGGAGSSGKGSLNAWLADKYNFHLATNNWSANSGHFLEFDDGRRVLNQHICSAFINKNTEIYINSGASIDLEILFKELQTLTSLGYNIVDRLTIHPNANIITAEDKKQEKEIIKSGSTFKGCGAALARKTLRVPGQKLARDYDEIHQFIKDRTYEINSGISKGMRILIEGSQGIDLDINHAEFPHTTSRQTHPTQLVADAGLPCGCVTNTIINLRTNPIRINNQSAADDKETCYSGNYWDAKEITWQDVAKQAGYCDYAEFENEYKYAMMTSVTKKLRRVFEFPIERMKFVHALCGGLLPYSDVLYSLNFVNFIDKNTKGVKTVQEVMTDKVVSWLNKNLYPIIGYQLLKWIRTGPRHSEIIEL